MSVIEGDCYEPEAPSGSRRLFSVDLIAIFIKPPTFRVHASAVGLLGGHVGGKFGTPLCFARDIELRTDIVAGHRQRTQ